MLSSSYSANMINMGFHFFFIYTLLLASILLVADPSLSVSATERCHPNEKKVLLKIKNAFNTSILNHSWLPNTDCCDWLGVSCESTVDNHVYSLFFMDGDFPGKIPDIIGELTYITTLTFSNVTSLTGPIPMSITKLQNLRLLEISSVNLTGIIPGFLSKLKKLIYINLSFNKLKGPIPTFLSEIPELGYIGLYGNQLTGTIPESLVKLKDNNLFLLLSHNKLSGQIPDSFRAINFHSLDFSHNNLHGDISMLFGHNKTTRSMNFAWNKFEFDMTDPKLQLYPALTELDISHNKIYGSLPKKMIYIQWEWNSLNVSYNRLCGTIPQGGYLQTRFHETSFFHNRCLCGAPLAVACK